jgi:hypothetical protein
MLLSRKEQLRYLIIIGFDIRKCQFAPNTGSTWGYCGRVLDPATGLIHIWDGQHYDPVGLNKRSM